jgi:GH43 family beta-xylosidase
MTELRPMPVGRARAHGQPKLSKEIAAACRNGGAGRGFRASHWGVKEGHKGGMVGAATFPQLTPAPGATHFTNPLYDGADPCVVRHGDKYYASRVGPGGRIEIYHSRSPVDRGAGVVVWTPPNHGWNRAQVWAPELHRVQGRWYVYYAASSGHNAAHRMGVLAATGDNPQGEYVDCGQLYTGDDVTNRTPNRWAIDGTVFELHDRLYFVWSGWEEDRDIQHLYIAPMSDPLTVSGNRVRICPNDCHPWERVGERRHERGLHEGPQVLHRHGRLILVYSCSGSWQPTYKLGMLHMDQRSDPVDPGAWTKCPSPVFESTSDVFGVGHCCFTTSPDGSEDWLLYHAKRHRAEGWHREVRAQPFIWRPDGFPDFGRPVSSGVVLRRPAESPARRVA